MSRPYVGDLGSGLAIVIGQFPCSCGLNGSGAFVGAFGTKPMPCITASYTDIVSPFMPFQNLVSVQPCIEAPVPFLRFVMML
jgi:hypothetical protein